MASVYDLLARDARNAGTLYDPDGVNNGKPIRIVLSNAQGMRTLRESSDNTTGVFPADPGVRVGQVLTRGTDWYIVAKSMTSPGASLRRVPKKVTLLHLAFLLAGTRGDVALSLRVLVRQDNVSMRPDGTLSEKMTLLCPLGADVQVGDRYTYNGFIYRVDAVSLASADGHAYGQELLADLVGATDMAPGGYPVTNSVIAVLRGVYNDSTKQTTAAPVTGLEAVPVFIRSISNVLREQGIAPETTLEMTWNAQYDIRDGDHITGYNPSGSAKPGILQVQHAADMADVGVFPVRVAQLTALEPAGYST